MRLIALQVLSIAAVVIGLAGCQSGPRWAWWKPKEASEDKSLLARSADPTLPSAQSTPQVAEAKGLQPAAPPSSTNLAAAGKLAVATPGSVPPVSQATISKAPAASYPIATPSGESVPISPVAMPTTVAAGPAPAAGGMTASSVPIAASRSTPAANPYDPDGYPGASPSTTVDQPLTGVDRYAASQTADRYGMAPLPSPSAASASAPGAASSEIAGPAPTSAPTSAPTGGGANDDRYGLATAERYGSSSAPSAATPTPLERPAPAAPSVPRASVGPSASAGVQVSASAGQYRPGGTSSYPSAPASQHVEVASRAVGSTSPSTSAQGIEGGGASVPWSPPGTSVPASGTAVRTY